MASAESLAAGIIFTVQRYSYWEYGKISNGLTPSNCNLGGLLGTMFTIALRRLFIVEEPLPEGVACREVLVAGEKGGSGLIE